MCVAERVGCLVSERVGSRRVVAIWYTTSTGGRGKIETCVVNAGQLTGYTAEWTLDCSGFIVIVAYLDLPV